MTRLMGYGTGTVSTIAHGDRTNWSDRTNLTDLADDLAIGAVGPAANSFGLGHQPGCRRFLGFWPARVVLAIELPVANVMLKARNYLGLITLPKSCTREDKIIGRYTRRAR